MLARLLRHHCTDTTRGAGHPPVFAPTPAGLAAAAADYEALRIPRTRKVLGSSHDLGKTQQDRADSPWYNFRREWSIRLQVALRAGGRGWGDKS